MKKIQCWTVLSCRQLRAKDDKCPQDGRRGQTHAGTEAPPPQPLSPPIKNLKKKNIYIYGLNLKVKARP